MPFCIFKTHTPSILNPTPTTPASDILSFKIKWAKIIVKTGNNPFKMETRLESSILPAVQNNESGMIKFTIAINKSLFMCLIGKIGVLVVRQKTLNVKPPTKKRKNTVKKMENSAERSLNIIADEPNNAPIKTS